MVTRRAPGRIALNYAPKVRRALAADDRETLERIRTRFSGALDLFGHDETC